MISERQQLETGRAVVERRVGEELKPLDAVVGKMARPP